jgi:hypothetical protein
VEAAVEEVVEDACSVLGVPALLQAVNDNDAIIITQKFFFISYILSDLEYDYDVKLLW